MKLSSLCLAVACSLAPFLLAAQANSVEFYLSDSQTVRTTENTLQYLMTPFRASEFQIRAFTQTEQRMNFNQNIRGSLLDLSLTLRRNRLDHTFGSGFEYHYDSNDLKEDYRPYKNKTGYLGYRLGLAVLDSLLLEAGLKGYIRSEEDRYLAGNTLNSEGYEASAGASFGAQLPLAQAGLGMDIRQKKLDWEYSRTADFRCYLNHSSTGFTFNNQFNLGSQRDSLYVLSREDSGRGYYSIYDAQDRNSLTYSGVMEYVPGDAFKLTAQEFYARRVTNFNSNAVRDNADYLNQASLSLDSELLPRLNWQATAAHTFDIKDFNYTRNTRHTENRALGNTLAWEFLPGDSLFASFSVDLQRTSFPSDEHRYDNDLRNLRYRLGSVWYWKDRVKLSNRFNWNQTDDIYVQAQLSANNKATNSLIYNPACAVLIGNRMMFSQNYTIRADYTSYAYFEEKKALYRQLELQYDLVFDTFPFVARSQDLRWMQLSFRPSPGNAFLTKLSFDYERNEYADYDLEQDLYTINFKNDRFTSELTVKHDIGDFYYIVQPKYSWGTWREYSLLAGLAWNFNNSSLLEFSLNPQGEALSDLDWRASANLKLQF